MCDNTGMRKSLTTATLLAGGVMMLGSALAQTSAPSTSSTTPAKPKTATTAKKPAATAKKPGTGMTLNTKKDKFSYAVGMSVGNTLKQQLSRDSMEYDPAILAQGVKDMLAGKTTLLTKEQAQAVLMEVQTAVRQKREEETKEAAVTNKKEGDEFLKKNTMEKDVVTLPSGLQYKVLKQGTGPKPTAADTVVCNYRGTLVNGKEFDSSAKHGGPATFGVGQVIKGWQEALQLMPVGSKWQLVVPPDLAYGDHAPPEIGPDQTLIFEVELVSIQGKEGK